VFTIYYVVGSLVIFLRVPNLFAWLQRQPTSFLDCLICFISDFKLRSYNFLKIKAISMNEWDKTNVLLFKYCDQSNLRTYFISFWFGLEIFILTLFAQLFQTFPYFSLYIYMISCVLSTMILKYVMLCPAACPEITKLYGKFSETWPAVFAHKIPGYLYEKNV